MIRNLENVHPLCWHCQGRNRLKQMEGMLWESNGRRLWMTLTPPPPHLRPCNDARFEYDRAIGFSGGHGAWWWQRPNYNEWQYLAPKWTHKILSSNHTWACRPVSWEDWTWVPCMWLPSYIDWGYAVGARSRNSGTIGSHQEIASFSYRLYGKRKTAWKQGYC